MRQAEIFFINPVAVKHCVKMLTRVLWLHRKHQVRRSSSFIDQVALHCMTIGRNRACSCWWLCWLCFTYLSPLAWTLDDDEVEDVSFQLENTHLDELKGATAHIIFYEKLEELLKLKRCSICRGIMTATPRQVGSALVVSYSCICGASGRWESQSSRW